MDRFVVARDESGNTIAAIVRKRMALSWSAAKRWIETGRVLVAGMVCTDVARRLQSGQKIAIQSANGVRKEPSKSGPKQQAVKTPIPRNAPPAPKVPTPIPMICFRDEHIVIVEKPAGLTTVRHPEEMMEFGRRAQRYLPPTLMDMLPGLLESETGRSQSELHLRAIHRLDKETSGLVVVACTAQAARRLGEQFREHSIERRYLALVRGRAEDTVRESHFIPDRGDGRRGSSKDGRGERAVTHVKVVERLGSFTLVECRLETGRTHQVRIHLGEAGFPLCGEKVYDRPLHGRPLPDGSGAERIALHAAGLELSHPSTGERLSWQSPLPEDMEHLLLRLRAGGAKEN